jgi:hypothetical protein
MKECIICKKTISSDRELCYEHKKFVISIVDAYNRDSEVRSRCDAIVDIVKNQGYGAADSDVEDVFKFVAEMMAESAK